MLQTAEWAGVMADKTNTDTIVKIANSPISILTIFNKFLIFILFLLPTIFGRTLARDFHQKTHSLLYSFPINKRDFLGAKFSIAFFISLSIIIFSGIGIFLGTKLPGYDPNLVTDFNPLAYCYIYGIYLIPNILLFGTIVFAIVLFTRNTYAGFISVLLLYFLQMGISSSFGNGNNDFLAALLDPFGQYAISYYTKNWTLTERNQLMLPIGKVVIYNRLLWLSMTGVLGAWLYRKFQFQQEGLSFKNSWFSRKSKITSNDLNLQDTFPPLEGVRGRKNWFLSIFQTQSPPIFFPKESSALQRGRTLVQTKNLFRHVIKVQISKIHFDYSIRQQLKTVWQLSKFEFKYIITGGLFFSVLIAGIGIIIFKQAEINPSYGNETLPMTWKMLGFPMHYASITIIILTFLYAGLLVHRGKSSNIHGLVDSTPIPNWVLLSSKFLALLKMQALLLLLVLFGGILVQAANGFYDFEISHYLFELFGLQWLTFIIWAFVAIFIQTLFSNAYLGFFMLFMGMAGIAHLHLIGIDHVIFKYNWGPSFHYSDMTGYATSLPFYLLYKLYWLIFGGFLFLGTYCWWNRGVNITFKERFQLAIAQTKGKTGLLMGGLLITFFSLGSFIWYEDQVLNKGWTTQTKERIEHKMTTQFDAFKNLPQPKIKSVFVEMNLFPASNDFQIKGKHTLVNTTNKTIDSLFIFSVLGNQTSYTFNQSTKLLLADTAIMIYGIPVQFELIQLGQPMQPYDTLICHFEIKNPPNTFLRRRSPVLQNGTTMQSPLFPRIGYWANEELPTPYDSTAQFKMHESQDADWVNFETIVSTEKGQIAIAPGDLQQQWTADNRAYFQYKTLQKIPLYAAYFSADYTIKKDKWKDIDLAVYHHLPHDYNANEMLRGLKAALAYNTENFGVYPLTQAKIVEAPSIYGHGGSAFAGTMAVSETAGFISKVDTTNGEGANTPFFIAVHEFSHQWWKLQLNPAAAKGSNMLMEALCQYSAMKCIERTFGKTKMYAFLKKERAWYLNGRRHQHHTEPCLLLADNEAHLNYAKGSLTFYTLSEYIGEATLNSGIKNFYDKFRLKAAPFGTAVDLVNEIRQITPDSLQYLITDLFEAVTFYDNRMLDFTTRPLNNEQYQVDLEFLISKHRIEGTEKDYEAKNGVSLTYQLPNKAETIASLPLQDYVEIGAFDETGQEIYLQKHKIYTIHNHLKILVNQRPAKVVIDPYFKLLERNIEDN